MASLDILPPTPPAQQQTERKGFFAKLFGKKEETVPPTRDQELSSFNATEEEFDLEEIRKKIGLDEQPLPPETNDRTVEEPTSFTAEDEPFKMPARPAEPVEEASFDIDDWTSDAHHRTVKTERASSAGERSIDWTAHHDEPTTPQSENEWTSHPAEETPASETTSAFNDEPRTNATDTPATETESEELIEVPPPETMTFDAPPEPGPLPVAQPAPKPAPDDSKAFKKVPLIADAHFDEIEEKHDDLDEEIAALANVKVPEKEPHPLDKPVPEGQEFILKNGQPLRTLRELVEALEHIDQETFFHHVNVNKNDFAQWILHVIKEEDLSERLKDRQARKDLARILKAHAKQADATHREQERRRVQQVKHAIAKGIDSQKLQEKLDGLQREIARKSAELAEQRNLLRKDVERQIASEIDTRLKAERRKIQQREETAARQKATLEKEAAAREKGVAEREAKLTTKQESLKKLEATLLQERARLVKERSDAEEMLRQARNAAAEIEATAREKERLLSLQDRLEKEEAEFEATKRETNAKQSGFDRLAKSLERTRQELERREQELEKKEASFREKNARLAEERAAFDKEAKGFRAYQQTQLGVLTSRQKQADVKLKKATVAEERANEKLAERRKIAQYIEDADRRLSEKEEGMQGFFDRKLKLAKSVNAPAPRGSEIRHVKIYAMVDEARHALEKKDTDKARHLYNRIRVAFNKEKLTPSEKEVLYTTIRELYDDIHLAGMK